MTSNDSTRQSYRVCCAAGGIEMKQFVQMFWQLNIKDTLIDRKLSML